MRNKFKVFLGIISVLLFVGLITEISGGSGNLRNFLTRRGLLSKIFESRERSVVRQQVVQEESSIIDVVDAVSPSVVSVVVKTVDYDLFSGPTSSEQGIGTGFIVDRNGLIVTNSHVVDNQDGEYSVVLKDGSTFDVTQVHLDEQTDLAILGISARNLPVAELGDYDALKVGQQAIAIGNALGQFSNTVTTGVISGISRELTASGGFGGAAKTYEGAIQTDAALNPGNSGGPLLNSAGQVIGINVATTRGADNIGFAIPVNTLKPILETFLAEGKIIRPYLGVEYSIITKEIAQIRRLPEGAFVGRVVNGSPAKKAGLERGDVITKFDGKSLSVGDSLAKLIREKKVGDKIEVILDRGGKELRVTVTLEEAPQS
jgi:serine protease Do